MNTAPWLTGTPARNPAVRLFLFPHAGGAASAYAHWLGLGGDDLEIRSVQYPGRETRLRERPPHSIDRLAGPLAEAVAAEPPGPASVFFGHSMGALVAYEVARLLRDQGESGPQQLFAAACAAPGTPRTRSASLLPDERLLDWLRSSDEASAAALEHPELAALVLPALRADLTAVETYRAAPARPLDCPLTVLTGADDTLRAAQTAAWRKCTTGEFRQHEFPGGHFFVRSSASELLAFIKAGIASGGH